MNCDNKNYILDLYFLEGSESSLNESRDHISNCIECREYYISIKDTTAKLGLLSEEYPSKNIFDKIAADISTTVPKPVVNIKKDNVIPILQIAFGQIFLFAVIYILNLKLSLSTFWITFKESWIGQSFGSLGIAIIVVLCIGTFITLSIAPVLMFESRDKKSFT